MCPSVRTALYTAVNEIKCNEMKYSRIEGHNVQFAIQRSLDSGLTRQCYFLFQNAVSADRHYAVQYCSLLSSPNTCSIFTFQQCLACLPPLTVPQAITAPLYPMMTTVILHVCEHYKILCTNRGNNVSHRFHIIFLFSLL